MKPSMEEQLRFAAWILWRDAGKPEGTSQKDWEEAKAQYARRKERAFES